MSNLPEYESRLPKKRNGWVWIAATIGLLLVNAAVSAFMLDEPVCIGWLLLGSGLACVGFAFYQARRV